MDKIALRRNKDAVLSKLKISNDSLICTEDCMIQIPVRFGQVNLADVSVDIYIIGIYALVLKSGEYSVSNMAGMIKITPTSILTKKIGEDEYYEFLFTAGSVISPNVNIVRKDLVPYDIFNEFIFKGGVPWYMEYSDVGKLLNSAKKYADSNSGNIYEVGEFIASIITRKASDRTIYYRLSLPSNERPKYVPLSSVFYSVNNTVNKLAGNYFSDGVTSALVNPTTNTNKLEELLRA